MNGGLRHSEMDDMEVVLFGAPAIRCGGVDLEVPRRQARAIVFILAAQTRPTSRDTICDMLWENATYAESRRNLTRLLTQLRQILPERAAIQANSEKLWINAGLVRSGIQPFENFSRNLSPNQHLEACSQIVELYQGEFLDGFNLPSAPRFDHWLGLQRHYFEAIYLHALHDLIEENASSGKMERAIYLAQRYLTVDEIDEHIQRRLIEMLAKNGNRLEAQRQFERYTRLLEAELNERPQPDLINAYHAALRSAPAP